MKVIISLIFGAVLHMLYVDAYFIAQYKTADSCLTERLENNPLSAYECVDNFNLAADNLRGKYFGLYRLLSYTNIRPGPWEME